MKPTVARAQLECGFDDWGCGRTSTLGGRGPGQRRFRVDRRRDGHAARMNVAIWNENVHECTEDHVRAIYSDGIHGALAVALAERGEVGTATLDPDEHGLPQAVLDATDVLTWRRHAAHDEVDDAVVDRVHEAVLGGMGLVVLHSGHYAKIFRRLLGTSCSLRWRNEGGRERVWTV